MAPRATYRVTSKPTATYQGNIPHHFSVDVNPAEPYEGGKWEAALLDVTFPKRRNPIPVVNLWSNPNENRVPWTMIVHYFRDYNENFFVFRIEFLYFFKYVRGRADSSTAPFKWDVKGVTVKDVRNRPPYITGQPLYVTGVDFIKWCIETTYKKIVEDSPGSATVGGQVMDKCVAKEFCPSFEWDGNDLISQVKNETLPAQAYQPAGFTEANAKTLRVLWSDHFASDLGWCDLGARQLGANASFNTSWAPYYVDSSDVEALLHNSPGLRCWSQAEPGNTHSGNALQPVSLVSGEKTHPGLILYGKRRYSMLRGSDGSGSTFRQSVAFQKESHNGQWMIHFPTSYEWRFRDINAAFWQAMGSPASAIRTDAESILTDYQDPDFHIEIQSNVVEGGILARVPYERYSEKQYQHYEMVQKEWKPVIGFTLSHINIGLKRSDNGQFYQEYSKKDAAFTPMYTSISLGFRKV